MTALILQARLDSSRLPGKSLLPLAGEPLVYRVMEALSAVPCDLRVLACPEDCVEPFGPLARRAGFELYAGPKDDVLARYCLAIRRYNPDRVIRATADNPFVFADAAAAIAGAAAALDADYAAYAGLPVGTGVEVVSAAALCTAEAESRLPEEREHVCPYVYNHPGLFRLHRPLAPHEWQSSRTGRELSPLRLTVDTPEDYRRAEELYRIIDSRTQNERRYHGVEILSAALSLKDTG